MTNTPHVVDAKYAADFQSLNAAEEEQGRRTLINTQSQGRRDARGPGAKDQPALIGAVDLDEKRKRGRKRELEQTDQQDFDDGAEEAAKTLGLSEGHRRLFTDLPEDALGDAELTDPNEMQRRLGPSVRFARHAMLLAEAKRVAGATREAALDYLAQIYIGCDDRAYANKALRAFGPATGIIDLYPLELMDQLLERNPDMLSKVSRGTIFNRAAPGALHGIEGQVIELCYPPELKLRGFAVKGGDRVGYRLEPADPPGIYHLVIETPGQYTLLFSALSPGGQLVLETRVVAVAEDPNRAPVSREASPKPTKSKKTNETPLRVVLPRRI